MKKKKLITVIIGLILVFVSWQAYMCDRYEGNLIINVSNQSERDTISLDLYIDGEKQASGLFTNEVFHNYKEYVFKTKKGEHSFLIKTGDGVVSSEVKVNTMLVTWIVVDFYDDDVRPDKEKLTFNITTHKKPFVIE